MRWEIALVLSIASTIGSLLLSRHVLLRLPPDYLTSERASTFAANRLMWMLRNVAGVLLVLVGIVLSVPGIPGQGLLTIAVGLLLLEVPGKRAVELRLFGHPRVLGAINHMRARANVPPLAPPLLPVH